MVPELVLKPKPTPEDLAKSTSIRSDPRGNLFPCVNNNRRVTFDLEQSSVSETTKPDRIENKEINITNVTRSSNAGMVGSDDGDTTETSSSFGDSELATDDDLGGDEVQSQSLGDQNPGSEFGGYYDMFRMRNKKLTPHWRRFIRPIMWRCKWMELRMKELQSQALRYEKELAAYDERKKLEVGTSSVSEDLEAKSLPFSRQTQKNQVMKRKKRKRVEETVDLASYMSQHNFFSYYENNKSAPNGPSLVDFGNLGNTSYHNNKFETIEEFMLESLDGDSQLEALFRDIESVQSRVLKLITRVDVAVYANSRKIPLMNKFAGAGLPQSPVVNSVPKTYLPCGKGKGLRKAESLCISSQSTSKKSTGDMLILDGGVPSHGEVIPRPEINASTDQFQKERVLIDNAQADEELNDFVRHQFGEKALVSGVVIQNPNPVPVPVPVPPSEVIIRPKGKKRKRKAGSRK